MLPDSIVLPVDEENNATIVNETLSRFEENLNRTVYVTESHSVANPDTLTFYRTQPKQNGNFRGVAKTSFKFSRLAVVPGVDGSTSISAPIIIEVSTSIPVGVDAADQLLARQRAIALLDLDTVMDPLMLQLMI